MRYIQSFNSSGAVQTALDEGELGNPYVALVEGEGLDYNTLEPTPPSADYVKLVNGDGGYRQIPLIQVDNDGIEYVTAHITSDLICPLGEESTIGENFIDVVVGGEIVTATTMLNSEDSSSYKGCYTYDDGIYDINTDEGESIGWDSEDGEPEPVELNNFPIPCGFSEGMDGCNSMICRVRYSPGDDEIKIDVQFGVEGCTYE